nr:reverse transcriptase domain-containing protein [Tanacetum cinerariifolium]
MTLELADRSISRPIGVAEDVYVKVGKFYFPADFVVVDFDADPRVPVILGRSFLKTRRASIDVFEGELTLRVGKEAITFNLDQTLRYSAKYNDMTTNRIDVIDMACEEYSQEVLGIEGVCLGFEAVTGAVTGSMIGATTCLEFKIRDSDWTTKGITTLAGSHIIYVLGVANGGWTIIEGMRKEIQTKGIIGAIGPPRPFKDGWHNSSIVRRPGTSRSPFPLAAISKSFKRVGLARDLLRIVSSRLSRDKEIDNLNQLINKLHGNSSKEKRTKERRKRKARSY